MPLCQKELKLEEVLLQTYHPGWELGDRLFLTRLFLELTQADLQAMAMTFQHLVEGARHSKKIQAAATPFFIKKESSLWLVQDYHALNAMMSYSRNMIIM